MRVKLTFTMLDYYNKCPFNELVVQNELAHLYKKEFLKISQNLQESTRARVSS